MPTINDYKKKALNAAGYSGDVNTAEYKWLRVICSPYKGSIYDMWRYALKAAGYTGNNVEEMQNKMLKALGFTDYSISNKWYKYWKTKPLQGLSSWTPSSLGSSLLAWWSADRSDLITLSGAKVTSWKDVKAGYDAVQATDASRPTYSATTFNGKPGVTFDGTVTELTCLDAALLATLPSGATPSELAAVVQQTALVADGTTRQAGGHGAAAGSSRLIGRAIVTSTNRGRTSSSGGVTATNLSVDFSGYHSIRGEIEATQISVVVDASTPVTAAIVPTSTPTRVRIGANVNSTAGAFWQGQIRHFIITGPLTTQEETSLDTWMATQIL